jgi:hypothetical protein
VQILEKVTHSLYGLPPTFAMGIGFIQVLPAIAVKCSGRPAILISIVTFSQTPIVKYRNCCIAQRDFNGLNGSSKIRGKDGLDVVMAASVTKFSSQATTFLREPPMVPAGRDTSLVIFA